MEESLRGLDSFAYVIPQSRFVLKHDGVWDLSASLNSDGILHHLMESYDWPQDAAKKTLGAKVYQKVYGFECAPNEPAIIKRGDRRYLNTWCPPTLKPEKVRDWITIRYLLNYLTNQDPRAYGWLVSWLAAKIQNPLFVPKIATVFTTAQGAGKGTLAFILRQILGEKNCASITRTALENQFNIWWVDKLFVFADEIMSADTMKDISDALKVYIDGADIRAEAKGKDVIVVRNKMAWMFASNDLNPVHIESTDRRYSVFSNHIPIEAEHKKLLDGLFEKDRVTPTQYFMEEIQSFWADMLEFKPDYELIKRPYDNGARQSIIQSNLPSHELFFKRVDEEGIDDMLDDLAMEDLLRNARAEWDFGKEGVTFQAIYQAYVRFCRQLNMHPLKQPKLGAAINSRPVPWAQVKKSTKKGSRVNCYVVPRKS